VISILFWFVHSHSKILWRTNYISRSDQFTGVES
jgi:hypothetical protein